MTAEIVRSDENKISKPGVIISVFDYVSTSNCKLKFSNLNKIFCC